MTADLLSLAHRYHAAMNACDLAAVERMMAANAEYHSPSVGGILGRQAVIAAMRSYFAEYPDQTVIDEFVCHAGPRAVMSRWQLRATARSNGSKVERRGEETIHFDHAGLIRRIEVRDL
jgi:hypothetical protein